MKNKFYKYFFQEFLSLLTLIILSLACVVWAVQAVNFLDLVTEGGHSFRLYFSYTILGLPKIIARLLPFSFLKLQACTNLCVGHVRPLQNYAPT